MLTRRTERFGELAIAIEERLESVHISVEPKAIDDILRHRIDEVAEKMRVTPRSALVYAPDDLPELIARDIVIAHKTAQGSEPTPPTLRVVK